MASIEVGRVCVKTAGREAGEKCAIVEIIDENFVEVVGEAVKNRRCNIAHCNVFLSFPSYNVVKIYYLIEVMEIRKKVK